MKIRTEKIKGYKRTVLMFNFEFKIFALTFLGYGFKHTHDNVLTLVY